MELIGSLFLILALAVIVVLYIGRPFLFKTEPQKTSGPQTAEQAHEHQISTLLAERDRVLNALQELDFDYSLGKVPADEYPHQRAVLLKSGADVLRLLDAVTPALEVLGGQGQPALAALDQAAEDRIEAAVAARRADAMRAEIDQPGTAQTEIRKVAAGATGGNGNGKDILEEMIASRKRQRKESAAGFCPRCGKPVQKSDKFCSKCGTTL